MVPEVVLQLDTLLHAALGAPVARASGSGKLLIEASSSGLCVVLVEFVSSVSLVRSDSVFSISWSRGERRKFKMAEVDITHKAATEA